MNGKLLLVGFLAASLMPIAAQAKDICKLQAYEFVEEYFEGEVEITSIRKYKEKDGAFKFWARVNACDGYLVFDFGRGKSAKCSTPHYGEPPIYFRQIWGSGDCKRILPDPYYPH